MTDADRPRLAKVLSILSEAFHEPVSEMRAEAYFLALEDLPIEALESAAVQTLRLSTFFPRPAEIRELIEGSVTDNAEFSWALLVREVKRVGWTGTPTLSPDTQEAVKHVWGDWVRLCQTLPAEGPELLGWAKQFKAVYSVTARRAIQRQLPIRDFKVLQGGGE